MSEISSSSEGGMGLWPMISWSLIGFGAGFMVRDLLRKTRHFAKEVLEESSDEDYDSDEEDDGEDENWSFVEEYRMVMIESIGDGMAMAMAMIDSVSGWDGDGHGDGEGDGDGDGDGDDRQCLGMGW